MIDRIADRVARGVALLDEYDRAHPRRKPWRKRIDVTRLDLHSPRWCILGQCFGSYYEGIWQIRDPGETDFAWKHGFIERHEYTLTAEWVRVLSEPEAEQEPKG